MATCPPGCPSPPATRRPPDAHRSLRWPSIAIAPWRSMQEYTASDALRKHMYAVELAMRAMAERAGEDADAWGLVGWCTTSTTSGFPTPPTRPPRSIRPRACGSSPSAGCPSRVRRAILGHAHLHRRPARHADGQGALRRGRAVRLPGGLRAGAAVPEPPGSRGLQRQEEAQGQGVRARREPRGCAAGRGRARASRWKSTSRSCSARSGLTSACSASAPHDRRRRRRRSAPSRPSPARSTAPPAAGRSPATRCDS